MGEHGPHGVVLGSDGLIYVVVGNLASVDGENNLGDQSPQELL